ncbi:hypothetical protein [Halosimplex marinum]|uniref:hypothetical protein n=1 Tax=Halosimplex marinum TaxID=3396620 RepID=UPI003F57B5A5
MFETLAAAPPQSTGAVLAAAPMQSAATYAAAAAFPLLTWVALVVWVYLDARARGGDHPVRSTLTVAVFPPALVAYVVYRPERTAAPSDRERAALTVLLALLSAMMAGTAFSPPDVFAQPRNTFGAVLVTLPLFYLLVYREDPEGADADAAS